jgi:membrane associated rhomboid family serine protease
MARSSPGGVSYSFGPGPLTPAVRAMLFANLGVYIATVFIFEPSTINALFGLRPSDVLRGEVWPLATYLFVHAVDPMHILFNMLGLWMFGVELERRWGTRHFTTYYFVTGVGAGLCVLVTSLLPFEATASGYLATTIGASGAIFGLMLAWALLFPDRQILFMLFFPLPARVFVLIMGAIQLVYAYQAIGSGVSSIAHLGGMVIGYLYLKKPGNLRLEWQYRMTKWRMERMRRRFGVHRGGKDDWQNRVH